MNVADRIPSTELSGATATRMLGPMTKPLAANEKRFLVINARDAFSHTDRINVFEKYGADRDNRRRLLILNIGYSYLIHCDQGKGEEENLKETLKWHGAVARNGDSMPKATATFNTGSLYHQVKHNYGEAIKYYNASANGGYASINVQSPIRERFRDKHAESPGKPSLPCASDADLVQCYYDDGTGPYAAASCSRACAESAQTASMCVA